MIKEWNLQRSLACLSIVLLHSTTFTGRIAGHPQIEYYHFFRILLCYATPTFIVLSVIILANKYSDGLPENFWPTRIKWIFLPFVSFAIIDGLNSKYSNPNIVLDEKIFFNLLGLYEGWFVLVIFQFYLLHYAVTRFKLSMTWLLPISLLIMTWYLMEINSGKPFVHEYRYYLRLPFLAWIGYFTVAFIIGKHYKVFAKKLYNYRWLTIIGLIISVGIIYSSFESGNTSIYSRRLDLFPLVLSVCATVLAWGQKIPQMKFVNVISNYSFGIYLVHWQIQSHIAPYTATYFTHTSTQVLSLFVISLLVSILIIRLVTFLPFGSFIVGKVRRKTSSKAEPQQRLKQAG